MSDDTVIEERPKTLNRSKTNKTASRGPKSDALENRKDSADYKADSKDSTGKTTKSDTAVFKAEEPKNAPAERHYATQGQAESEASATTKIEQHKKSDIDNGFGPATSDVPDPTFYVRDNEAGRVEGSIQQTSTATIREHTQYAAGLATTRLKGRDGENPEIDYSKEGEHTLKSNVSSSLPNDYLDDVNAEPAVSGSNEPGMFEKVATQLKGEFEQTRDEMARMTGFTKNTAKFAVNTGKIAYYESLLNLKLKSKAAALGAAALPLAYLAWLGLSITIALFVGDAFDSPTLGALAFTLVQVAAVLFVLSKRKKVQEKTNMRQTKDSIEAYRHAYRGENHPLHSQNK